MAGIRSLRLIVKLDFCSSLSKLHTSCIVRSGVNGMPKPSDVLAQNITKNNGDIKVSSVNPTTDEHGNFLQHLEHPKEPFSSIRDILLTASRHSKNLDKLILDALSKMKDGDEWKDFERFKGAMDDVRSCTNGELLGRQDSMLVKNLLQACERSRNPDDYFAILKFLEGLECKFRPEISMQFINCMAACGWLKLAKRNVKNILGSGITCFRVRLVHLAQIFVENGDAAFAMELLTNFKKVSWKGPLDLTRDNSYHVLKALLNVVIRDVTGEWQHKLVKAILDIYQEDDKRVGLNWKMYDNIIEVLEKADDYSIQNSKVQSDGRCGVCETKLLSKAISDVDRAMLSEKVNEATLKQERAYIPHSAQSQYEMLKAMMEMNSYGIIINGLYISSCVKRERNLAKQIVSAIREFTSLRKLVIHQSHEGIKDNLFKLLDDFDTLYIDTRVSASPYLLCAGLLNNHNLPVLTSRHVHQFLSVLDREYHDTMLHWTKTQVVLLKKAPNGQSFIMKPPGQKVPFTAEAKTGHCHLMFMKDNEVWSHCIQKL